jgi:hypothetical protein
MVKAIQGRMIKVLSTMLAAAAIAGCKGVIGSPGAELGQGSAGTSTGNDAGGVDSSTSRSVATDPGRITMHRLNLAEYDNTMRDLLGTTSRPSVDFNFPPDDRGDDFDNISDLLTVSPLHLSCYNAAATALISAAMASSSQRSLLVQCDLLAGGATCARTALAAFLPRAWRREVTTAEIDHLMTFVTMATAQGDTTEAGFDLALRAALLSPNFIFRPEIDPSPTSLTPHPVSDYELASRLSYFLWSSMPDDSLFATAKAGTLHETNTLEGQITRMLADAKAQAIVDNFAGQWLFIRKIDEVTPDPTLFPQFDASLRSAMKAETQMLFHDVAFNGLPANQLLTAQYTYVNDRLAQYYGLPPVGSTQPQRVDLTGNSQRRGFLSHSGILTVNSHADRTSPVLRGKFVLTELLCENVPPPPPNVNTTIVADPAGGKTLRQVLEAHIQNATCAACHNLMDPIGFSMENYDAVGAYRTMDNYLPIDSTGMLPGGQQFNGLIDLTQILGNNPAFAPCMTSKLYSYALGRTAVLTDPTNLDATTLQALSDRFAKSGLNFQDLVTGVITSPTFLTRRGDGG